MHDPTSLHVARSELILGGQKSGKSRRAETLAQVWLSQSDTHQVVLIATAQAGDDEMRQRIARHQADRAQRLPGITTLEEPLALAEAIRGHSRADTLIIVDCLTLWLTNRLMPVQSSPVVAQDPAGDQASGTAQLLQAMAGAAGPLVLVGNEIGLGVIPMGREVRAFVDTVGLLNQVVAQHCQRVTLMVAGLPLSLKDVP
jgi:adenosylcobinamide kinase/adenosylcobinamide-phosphate guanylyltransferase